MTKATLYERYLLYVQFCDDGNGIDRYTGESILTFDQWLNK